MTLRKSFVTAAAVSLIAVAASSVPVFGQVADSKPRHTAEEIAKAKPSGRIEATAEQIRLLVGGAQGRGTLYYGGKQYPFTMKAVTAGGVGVTKVNATGDVYFLEKLEDFPGTYSAVSIGATVGAGAGGSQYENNKGVFISVKSKSEGVGLSLGVGAVSIEFAKK
jgi:hypothetical protein